MTHLYLERLQFFTCKHSTQISGNQSAATPQKMYFTKACLEKSMDKRTLGTHRGLSGDDFTGGKGGVKTVNLSQQEASCFEALAHKLLSHADDLQ